MCGDRQAAETSWALVRTRRMPPGVGAGCDRESPRPVRIVRMWRREILPLIRATRPFVRCWIVGRDPPSALTALNFAPNGVAVTGTVSNTERRDPAEFAFRHEHVSGFEQFERGLWNSPHAETRSDDRAARRRISDDGRDRAAWCRAERWRKLDYASRIQRALADSILPENDWGK